MDLCELLTHAFSYLSLKGSTVLKALIASGGHVRHASEFACTAGFHSRYALYRSLRRDGLPPIRELASWIKVLQWLREAKNGRESLFKLALEGADQPETCYRLVRRVTGSSWVDAKRQGFDVMLARFVDHCRQRRALLTRRATGAIASSSADSVEHRRLLRVARTKREPVMHARLWTLCLTCGVAAAPLDAQGTWWAPTRTTTFGLELLRPTIRDDTTDVTEIDLTTFAAFLSASVPIAGKFRARLELPVARIGGFDPGFGTLDGATIGNPYLGVAVGPTDHGLSAELGARLPLTSDSQRNAAWVGLASDLARYAFLIDWTTFAARVSYLFHDPGGFTFEAAGGPSLHVRPPRPGETQRGLGGYWHLDFRFTAGYESPTVRLVAGFAGWTAIGPGSGGVGERTVDQLEATASLTAGPVQPALHVIVPMDDRYSHRIPVVVGIGVRYVMRPSRGAETTPPPASAAAAP